MRRVLNIILYTVALSMLVILGSSPAIAVDCWLFDENMTGCMEQSGCQWMDNGFESWCEMIGCWSFNGDMEGCADAIATLGLGCEWKPNDLNQNSWCPIKQIGDPSPSGPVNSTTDIGCCEMQGCWALDGTDEASCEDPGYLNGICEWHHKNASDPLNYDPFCYNDIGCCVVPPCETFYGEETKCNAANSLGFNCIWNDPNCDAGGCQQYDNNQEECLNHGCNYNVEGQCKPPEFMDGGFIGAQACWFADNNPSACMNITGCVYCTDDAGLIAAQSGGGDLSNINSFCYMKSNGYCEGHDPSVTDAFIEQSESRTALGEPLASDSIECSDIQIKMACNCGPFPMCQWSNSSTTTGPYCEFINRTKTDDEMASCRPTIGGEDVKFCEDPKVINEANCTLLKTNFNMPCKWDSTNNKCTFMFESIFKEGGVGDIWEIDNTNGGETACLAAKGMWNCEYYEEDDGSIQEECFCKMGSTDSGAMVENCNSFCPACEFYFANGSQVNSSADAQAACTQSQLGYCQFVADSNAPNGYGFCKTPPEFAFGMGDCKTDCKSCGIVSTDPGQQQSACEASPAGCQWVVSDMGNFCQSNSKMTCDVDCMACMSQTDCDSTMLNCEWDTNSFFCKPSGFEGEICFDGTDNDYDNNVDCMDPDCLFNEFCGGGMFGNCGQHKAEPNCTAWSVNIGGVDYNCSWVLDPYSNSNRCANPGEQCWMFDNNETKCIAASGCEWVNMTEEGESGWCDINKNAMEGCMGHDDIACAVDPMCFWMDPDGEGPEGWCEFAIFQACGQLNSSLCALDGNCTWKEDPFMTVPEGMEAGRCEPACFANGIDSGSCSLIPFCSWKETMCEPVFAVDCYEFDGNQTGCEAQPMCQWYNNSGEALCDPAAGGMVFGDMSFSQDMMMGPMDNSMMGAFEFFHLGDDEPSRDWVLPNGWTGTQEENDTLEAIDIRYFGIKDMGTQYGFGIGVTQTRMAAMCNGKPDHWPEDGTMNNTGQNTTKFYWYLDTDGSETGSCNATDENGNKIPGFEFLITYRGYWDPATSQALETKNFYSCQNGVFTLTSVPTYLDKTVSCQMLGGAGIGVDKENLEKFPNLYDSTATMRIFVTSGPDASTIADSAAPGYFKHGTVDFKPECCLCPGDNDMDGDGKPASTDEECAFIKQKGFMSFEDCFNGKDDNNDGLTDCDDPICAPMPKCGGTFTFMANANDKSAPSVIFQKVDEWPDGAFIKFDTNEPAGGEIKFYGQDSMCAAQIGSVVDEGDPDFAFDDYKPFHGVVLDINSLGYALNLSTAYYYKLRVEDPSGNAGESACLNFTTKSTFKKVLFDIDLDQGYTVDFECPGFSKTNWTGEYAIKINLSYTKKCNLTIRCGEGDYDITLVGVDITSPGDIDLQGKMVCDPENQMMGMDSDEEAWSQTLYDLGMGGAGDKIKEEYPIGYDSENIIYHCDEDNLSDCDDITDYADCSGDSEQTVCFIPTSIGYSAHQIEEADEEEPDSPSGGGGGGGGRVAVPPGISRYWDSLSIGLNEMNITSDDYGIKSINFYAKKNAKKVTIRVQKFNEKPENLTKINRKVYRYLMLNKENLSDSDLQGYIQIKFKIPRQWLVNNSVAEGNVVIKRYVGVTWEDLETIIESSDDKEVWYSAHTPGFSYFAIGEKEAVAEEPVVEAEEETEQVVAPAPEPEAAPEPTPEAKPAPTAEEKEAVPASRTSIILAVFIVLVIALVFAVLHGDKKHKKKEKEKEQIKEVKG